MGDKCTCTNSNKGQIYEGEGGCISNKYAHRSFSWNIQRYVTIPKKCACTTPVYNKMRIIYKVK